MLEKNALLVWENTVVFHSSLIPFHFNSKRQLPRMTFLVEGLFGSQTDTPGEKSPGNPDPNIPQILSDENNLCY